MSYTLFDATLDLARTLMQVREGVTSGAGSTACTTLVDTGLSTDYPDDFWNNGTLWVPTRGAVAAQYKKCTDYVQTSYTLTFDALTSSVGSGVSYRVAPKEFPLYILLQKINAVLRGIGPLPLATVITSVAGQSEYDNTDDSIFDEEIIGIEQCSTLSGYYPGYTPTFDPDVNYNWKPNYHWKQHMESPRRLTFDYGYEPQDSVWMRLTYLSPHTELSVETAVINDQVHPDRLRWMAALECWRWKEKQMHSGDGTIREMLVEAQQLANLEAGRHPINKQKIRLARW